MIMFRLDPQKAAAGYRICLGFPAGQCVNSPLENGKDPSRFMGIPFMGNF